MLTNHCVRVHLFGFFVGGSSCNGRHFGLPTDDDGGLGCEHCSVVGWVDGRSFGWCLLGVGDVLAGDHHGGASRDGVVGG